MQIRFFVTAFFFLVIFRIQAQTTASDSLEIAQQGWIQANQNYEAATASSSELQVANKILKQARRALVAVLDNEFASAKEKVTAKNAVDQAEEQYEAILKSIPTVVAAGKDLRRWSAEVARLSRIVNR